MRFHSYGNARVVAFIRAPSVFHETARHATQRARVDFFFVERELRSRTGDFDELHFYCFTRAGACRSVDCELIKHVDIVCR